MKTILILCALVSSAIAQEFSEVLRRAAAGDADYQFSAGQAYWLGSEAPQNFALSFLWTQRAASNSSVPAQFQLAIAFESGLGVKKNPLAKKRILLKLSNEGNSLAQRLLGHEFYLDALTVTQESRSGILPPYPGIQTNLLHAYKWINLACVAGWREKEEETRLNILEALNQETLQIAQRYCLEFKPVAPTPLNIDANGNITIVKNPVQTLKTQQRSTNENSNVTKTNIQDKFH